MYDVLKAQADRFFKPFTEIANIQVKLFEDISQKQSECLNSCWQESLSYARHLPEKKNFDDVVKSNQAYLEQINSRWRNTAEASAEAMAQSNQKISALIQDSMKGFNPAAMTDIAAMTTGTRKAKKVAAPASNKASSAKTSSKSKSASSGRGTSKSSSGKASATKTTASKAASSKSAESKTSTATAEASSSDES